MTQMVRVLVTKPDSLRVTHMVGRKPVHTVAHVPTHSRQIFDKK